MRKGGEADAADNYHPVPFRDDLSDERPTDGPLFPFRHRKEHIFSPSRIHAGLGMESTYPLSGIIDGESGERH
ncbi:hypothetical protein GWI33_003555 [Rhynchophorus ferrugineus]|uniref:Uncharacterized protein n=1 Tax=Rhynchophorus ferrugineus TaxID=354439 RepID=A0A834HKF6_RHYFE|nr:hypothetical protein GWI33_003555 [Rhynchophorus ferrugineus]